ncbi:MAG: nucleotidyltransferase domain-containing protein [Sphingomonadaceae bacterium]|nr:nucleotidyltransferase domain-containing protein [Sphingomonadaceae bacterium]
MKRDEAIARLRRHLPALRAEGVRGVGLFGSTARDEARADSDVDLLLDVDFEAKPSFSLFDLARIQMMLQDDLGVPVQPIVSAGSLPRMRANIERDLIPIVG